MGRVYGVETRQVQVVYARAQAIPSHNRRNKKEKQMFETEALKETWEALVALRNAVKPFHDIALDNSGRIQTERLSAADWHNLWKAYNAPPPRGAVTPNIAVGVKVTYITPK